MDLNYHHYQLYGCDIHTVEVNLISMYIMQDKYNGKHTSKHYKLKQE